MPPNNLPQGMPFGPNGPNFGQNMGPQGIPPGMPNSGPEAWARQNFVPNPERPQGLQNTIGGIGGGEMGMRLRQALASNQITKVEMDRWTREPWLAYPFLNSVISTNDPMMQQLSRWYLAARVGRSPEEQRAMAVRWEQSEPQSAAMIRGIVNSVYGGLSQSMNTQMATNQELRQLREASSSNVLEGFGTKFMDYMRDWRDHPVTAAGVVVGFYMLFKAVKNRNIGAVLGIGAVGVALYSFFRDQYGIEPIESIAKATDKWGLPTASNIIRKTLDTVRRPFQPAEVEGSAFSYLGDQKLGINGDDEKRMLGVIWGMKPGDFLAAHQAILNQSMGSPDGRVQLPPAAREILRRMGADQTIARKWNNYSERQRAEIFLKVSSKIVAAMPGGMRFGTKFISDRYVTGAFFQESFGRQGGKLATARSVNPQQQQIASDMQYAVQHADMKMGDVMITTLMTPDDWQKIQGYKHGYSAMQMFNGVNDAGKSVLGWVQDTAGSAWDVVGKEGGAFVDYNMMPFLRRHGITQDAIPGIANQANIALRQARNSISGFHDFVVGTQLYRVASDGSMYLWNQTKNAWDFLMKGTDSVAGGLERAELESWMGREADGVLKNRVPSQTWLNVAANAPAGSVMDPPPAELIPVLRRQGVQIGPDGRVLLDPAGLQRVKNLQRLLSNLDADAAKENAKNAERAQREFFGNLERDINNTVDPVGGDPDKRFFFKIVNGNIQWSTKDVGEKGRFIAITSEAQLRDFFGKGGNVEELARLYDAWRAKVEKGFTGRNPFNLPPPPSGRPSLSGFDRPDPPSGAPGRPPAPTGASGSDSPPKGASGRPAPPTGASGR